MTAGFAPATVSTAPRTRKPSAATLLPWLSLLELLQSLLLLLLPAPRRRLLLQL